MFCLVQFKDDDDGLSIVRETWLTPQKQEVFWPPPRNKKSFDKVLLKELSPDRKNWKIYRVRCLYKTEELDKAKRKLKLAEVTSDLQTDLEQETAKRKRSVPIKYSVNSDIEDSDAEDLPQIKKQFLPKLKSLKVKDTAGQSYSQLVKNPLAALSPTVNDTTAVVDIETLTDNTITQKTKTISGGENSKESLLESTAVEVSHIKTQITQILSIVQEIKVKLYQDNSEIPNEKLHINCNFPLNNFSDVDTLEEKLLQNDFFNNLVTYLRLLGGHNVSDKTSRVMKYVLSDPLASKYSYYGKRSNKLPFGNLRLNSAIVDCLKSSTTTEKEIEDNMKSWLKHAPDREKARLKRSINSNN